MASKQAPAAAARLSTRQVMAGFNVSDMTVFTWRKGTSTRDPMPSHADGRLVYFKEAEMLKYAKKHDLTWDSAKAAKAASAPMKTGPKPAAVKAAPVKSAAKKAAPVKVKPPVRKVARKVEAAQAAA